MKKTKLWIYVSMGAKITPNVVKLLDKLANEHCLIFIGDGQAGASLLSHSLLHGWDFKAGYARKSDGKEQAYRLRDQRMIAAMAEGDRALVIGHKEGYTLRFIKGAEALNLKIGYIMPIIPLKKGKEVEEESSEIEE